MFTQEDECELTRLARNWIVAEVQFKLAEIAKDDADYQFRAFTAKLRLKEPK